MLRFVNSINIALLDILIVKGQYKRTGQYYVTVYDVIHCSYINMRLASHKIEIIGLLR